MDAGLFWFPSSVLLPLRCLKIIDNLSNIYAKTNKKREKWRPGVVLGALGRALGGIWAPRRPKAQKRVDFDPPPVPPEGPFWEPFWHLFLFGSLLGP